MGVELTGATSESSLLEGGMWDLSFEDVLLVLLAPTHPPIGCVVGGLSATPPVDLGFEGMWVWRTQCSKLASFVQGFQYGQKPIHNHQGRITHGRNAGCRCTLTKLRSSKTKPRNRHPSTSYILKPEGGECNRKVATSAGWVFGDRLTVFIFAPPTRLLAWFSRFAKER